MKKALICRLALALVLTGQLILGCAAQAPPADPPPSAPPATPALSPSGEEPTPFASDDTTSTVAPRHDGPTYVEKGHAHLDGDPLADALEVGLNQAWYIERGYADDRAELPPIAPATFPSPTPSPQIYRPEAFHHLVFLPLVAKAPMIEARALWVTRWDYSSAADVQTLMANAAGAGFNIIMFQVRGNADAFYTPGLEPWAARLTGSLGGNPGWDPLQIAVSAAHAHGLELHAYVNVYPVWIGEKAPSAHSDPAHLYWTLSTRYWGEDPNYPSGAWRVYTSDRKPMLLNENYLYASPAILDMDEHLAAVAKDIVSRYAVDGVHLDLVRYPGRGYSYDPTTEAALAPGTISRPDWQRQRVTDLVSRVYSEAAVSRPGLMLSAAVWPVYKDHWGWGFSQGYSDVYQDSQGWMKGRVIDAILPMIYPVDTVVSPNIFTADQFALLTSDFLANSGGRHVFPGISAQYSDFGQIAQRIAIARDLGAPGHAIFSARLVAQNNYWHHFAAGPYANKAQVPPLSWRP